MARIMKSISTLLKPAVVLLAVSSMIPTASAQFPYLAPSGKQLNCPAIFPDEPCFKDPERCYAAWRDLPGEWHNPIAPDYKRDVNEKSMRYPTRNTDDPAAEPPSFDIPRFHAIANITGDQYFIDAPTSNSSDLEPRGTRIHQGDCCRFTEMCAIYISIFNEERLYYQHEDIQAKLMCCLDLWAGSCELGKQEKFVPFYIWPEPRCTRPRVHEYDPFISGCLGGGSPVGQPTPDQGCGQNINGW